MNMAESVVFLSPVCCQAVNSRICYVSAVILVPDCAQQILLHFCRQSAVIVLNRVYLNSAANLPLDCARQDVLSVVNLPLGCLTESVQILTST
ncbi:hypothetical protein EAI_10131 [Harpegnathos saltator]|uniref:Uncharacterized protein n=1 Tax=Harpegnathos saltator TaxID=610380 RepID=E2BNC1_HARSA|nr:hypothetical protein EAI_10131 [Harpegnathos saltator]